MPNHELLRVATSQGPRNSCESTKLYNALWIEFGIKPRVK